MNTTVRVKASEIYKDWHVIDAAGRSLGRVATEAATLLRGKHKPTYEPHLDDGDFVIIINASAVRVTGQKAAQMMYYRHSGYPGGLKSRSYPEQLERFPERVIERAVKGMLPKGPLGEKMAKHLKVYRGETHPHQSQIVGSEKAKAAREAAFAATLGETKKPPRLRPLSIPEVAGFEEPVEAVVVAAPEPAEAPKRTRRKAAEAPVEAAAAVATEEATEAVEAAAEKKPRRRAAAKTEE